MNGYNDDSDKQMLLQTQPVQSSWLDYAKQNKGIIILVIIIIAVAVWYFWYRKQSTTTTINTPTGQKINITRSTGKTVY